MSWIQRRNRRRGEAYYSSSRRLPPTQERVRRFIVDGDDLAAPGAVDVTGGMGRSPISAPTSLWSIFYPPGRRHTTPLPSKPFSAVDYWRSFRQLSVRVPAQVRFCVQRKQRRETLFALRRVGFRGSSPGKRRTYRRSQNSQYGC